MFTIEKNKPIPEVKRGPKNKYPFSSMEVGDSFNFDVDANPIANVRNSAYAYCKRHANLTEFVCLSDGSVGTCWRKK